MTQGLDAKKAEAALKRAAHRALHGTPDERAGASSAIMDVEYNARTGDLDIRFVTGRRYRYLNVPADVYEAFVSAESKGAFFNREIRDKHPFRELPG
jgi:lysyl-tRNA synthetase class 2